MFEVAMYHRRKLSDGPIKGRKKKKKEKWLRRELREESARVTVSSAVQAD
jgi:hypothetical protein